MLIGVLHPGAMGATLVATLAGGGHKLLWCAAGRSEATHARATAAGATELATLAQLTERCELIVAVCPPDKALQLARAVAEIGFAGLYLDANAIAPMCAAQIAALFGARYVDGGIIGLPAVVPGTTRLYLSGAQAEQVASLFTSGPMAAQVLSESADVCAASALKMSYAAFTKGSSALLLGVCALAEAYGVGQSLQQEWSLSQPALLEKAELTARAVAPKAWRFEGEMQEIANTFSAVGLPGEFHQAAADLYRGLAGFKGQVAAATLPEVVAALVAASKSDQA